MNTPNKKLRIATRSSPLALWQAHHVAALLQKQHPHLEIELIQRVTKGDKNQNQSLANMGGKTLFVKELQRSLLHDEADIAVHCIKDMSVKSHESLCLGAILQRGNPGDAFISNQFNHFNELPENARVGTASPRRKSLLLATRPDLSIQLLRGNVNSRLAKLDAGEYDAIILACIGLIRLDLKNKIKHEMPISSFIPAIGQGALGIECRQNDKVTLNLIAPLNDTNTAICIEAERNVNRILDGNCFSPLGIHAITNGGMIHINAFVGSEDGSKILRASDSQPIINAKVLSQKIAADLLNQGAEKLLHA